MSSWGENMRGAARLTDRHHRRTWQEKDPALKDLFSILFVIMGKKKEAIAIFQWGRFI